MPADINIGDNYELDENSNGNLVIRDSTGNGVLEHTDGGGWSINTSADINDLTDSTSGNTVYDSSTETFGDGNQNGNFNTGNFNTVNTAEIDTDFRNAASVGIASKFTSINLADGGSSGAVDGISQLNGVLTVINITFGTNALISLQGGGGGADIIADPQTDFSVTAGTSDSTNVFYSSSNSQYEIENNKGQSVDYRIIYLGSN